MDNNNKCKSATTSVPSISIKFHANAEQLEEIHTDDEESASSTCTGGSTDKGAGSSDKSTVHSSTSPVTNINEPECSPLKYLPKLVKRSTSIDVSSSLSQQQDKQATDSSPPASDPWRFFSDIKGKITKSVEEKITEIKSRNQEEGSPHHKQKASSEQPKTTKDSKENSSVSDSEDLSESSISRTCGILSTTEGVEMSSDEEDTPSMEEKKKGAERPASPAAVAPPPYGCWYPPAAPQAGGPAATAAPSPAAAAAATLPKPLLPYRPYPTGVPGMSLGTPDPIVHLGRLGPLGPLGLLVGAGRYASTPTAPSPRRSRSPSSADTPLLDPTSPPPATVWDILL